MQHIIKGKLGEAEAYDFLKNKGYKIIAQNFKNKIGEIDIIAMDKDYIVFIEVKARRNAKFGLPCEAVDENKQRKIRMVASSYLQARGLLDYNVRFDVIDILADHIRHIENAF